MITMMYAKYYLGDFWVLSEDLGDLGTLGDLDDDLLVFNASILLF
jgi:hypothetical protein